jgi:hypothetical protein
MARHIQTHAEGLPTKIAKTSGSGKYRPMKHIFDASTWEYYAGSDARLDHILNVDAWQKCEANLEEPEDAKISIKEDEPDRAELDEAINKLKPGKSCAGIMPPEFIKQCDPVKDIILNAIQRFWRGERVGYRWMTAEIKLVHKKGKRQNPANYRPIALLNVVENLVSRIIYNRMIKKIPQMLDHKQVGFLPGKSGRSAVYQLLRAKEEAEAKREKRFFVFVDFQKAFDSLNHDTMLSVLKKMGCPDKVLEVLNNIYSSAEAKLKFGPDDHSEPMKHERGIRQGSALSPLLFITCLDWAMKRTEEALSELGIPKRRWHWLAYADDIVIGTNDQNVAQEVLKQLEAACMFLGLQISNTKTETMPINATARRVVRSKAQVEFYTYTITEKEGNRWVDREHEAKLLDYNGAQEIFTENEIRDIETSTPLAVREATHWFQWNKEGDSWSPWYPAIYGKTGHITIIKGRMSNGEPILEKTQIRRIGRAKYIDKQLNKHVCEVCDTLFHDHISLKCHKSSGHCVGENMKHLSWDKQNDRARVMNTEAKNRMFFKEMEESIAFKTIKGGEIPCCGTFKYLGTRIAINGGISVELRRRVELAQVTMRQMKRTWKSKCVGVKAKKQFFNQLILAGLLYNCETWALDEVQKDFLSGAHHELAKQAMGERKKPRKNRDGTFETREQFYKRHKLEPVEAILTNRKATWIGHAKRNKDEMMIKAFEKARSLPNNWWEELRNDIQQFGVNEEWLMNNAENRGMIRGKFKVHKGNARSDQQLTS